MDKTTDNGFTVEQYIKLWESEANEKDSILLNLLIVGYISSDTLLTKQDCLNSKNELIKMKEALDKAAGVENDKKSYYSTTIMTGIEICERDYKKLSE